MIHLDRNHHPSPLSPHSKQNLILPKDNILAWDVPDLKNSVQDINPDTAHGPVTPVDMNDPVLARTSGPSSPASPADGNSASPTQERSSSLSPVPSPQTRSSPLPDNAPVDTAADQVDKSSRQSTPLSELSPPPDDLDVDPPKPDDTTAVGETDETEEAKEDSEPTNNGTTSPQAQDVVQASPTGAEEVTAPAVPSIQPSSPNPSIDSVHTPSVTGSASGSSNGGKVVSILELNNELLKCVQANPCNLILDLYFPHSRVVMEFQARGITAPDIRFQQ